MSGKYTQDNVNGQNIMNFNVSYNYIQNNKKLTIPSFLTLLPNLNGIIEFPTPLKDIETILSDKNIVQINGIAGVGKSSLAKSYFYRCVIESKFKHYVFLQFKDNIIDTFVYDSILLDSLNINRDAQRIYTDANYRKDIFSIILYRLQNITANGIIVIDNSNNYNSTDIDNLVVSNWKIIYTSKKQHINISSYTLNSLNEKEAVKLYSHFYSDNLSECKHTKLIVQQMGFHPFAIELISKNAKYLNEKPFDTLERIKIENLSLPLNFLELDFDDQESNISSLFEKLFEHFNIQNLKSNDAIFIIYCLSPNINYSVDEIFTFYQINESNLIFNIYKKHDIRIVLSKLYHQGWLSKVDLDTYTLHKLIAEVALPQLIQNSQKLPLPVLVHNLTKKYNKFNSEFKNYNYCLKNYILSYNLITKFEYIDREEPLSDYLSFFLNSIGQPEYAIIVLEKALKSPKIIGDTYFKGLLYSRLGPIYQSVENYEKAEYIITEYYKIRKEDNTKNPTDSITLNGLSVASELLSKFYSLKNQDYAKSVFYQVESVKIMEILYEKYKSQKYLSGLAYSYLNLSVLYSDNEDVSNALIVSKKAFYLIKRQYTISKKNWTEKNQYELSIIVFQLAKLSMRNDDSKAGTEYLSYALGWLGDLSMKSPQRFDLFHPFTNCIYYNTILLEEDFLRHDGIESEKGYCKLFEFYVDNSDNFPLTEYDKELLEISIKSFMNLNLLSVEYNLLKTKISKKE